MKKILPVVTAVILASCGFERNIEVTPTVAELVKIDTIHRQSDPGELILTWRTEDNIRYISFEPMESAYAVGSRMKVLIRR